MRETLTTIAIADHKPERVQLLKRFLQLWGYSCSGVATNGLETFALTQLYKPQLLLIGRDMPDIKTETLLEQLTPFKTTGILLIGNDSHLEACEHAMDQGAVGFVLEPFDASQVRATLQSAWHRFQKEKTMRAEIETLQDGLETRKLIDRAKGILIAERGITEPEAYRLLQKMSQDKRVSIKEVCRAVEHIRLVVGKAKNKTMS